MLLSLPNCYQGRFMLKWYLFGVCWLQRTILVGNDQVQVKEKSKIETSFLYTFDSFQIEV